MAYAPPDYVLTYEARDRIAKLVAENGLTGSIAVIGGFPDHFLMLEGVGTGSSLYTCSAMIYYRPGGFEAAVRELYESGCYGGQRISAIIFRDTRRPDVFESLAPVTGGEGLFSWRTRPGLEILLLEP